MINGSENRLQDHFDSFCNGVDRNGVDIFTSFVS